MRVSHRLGRRKSGTTDNFICRYWWPIRSPGEIISSFSITVGDGARLSEFCGESRWLGGGGDNWSDAALNSLADRGSQQGDKEAARIGHADLRPPAATAGPISRLF